MSTSEYAFKLSQKLGWPHTLEKWRIMENAGTLLTLGEPTDLDGTAVVTHYDWGSALGMVLISPEKQRSGKGLHFTKEILKTFEEDVLKTSETDRGIRLVLTSSHNAESLYAKVGFEPIGSLVILKRTGQADKEVITKGAINTSGEEISREFYDACPVRAKILQDMIEGSGHSVCLKDASENVEAFASSFKRVTYNGREELAIGPILEGKQKSVTRLIEHFTSSTVLDLTVFSLQGFKGENTETKNYRSSLLEVFAKLGFRKIDELHFMSHGGKTIPHLADVRKVSPMSLAFS